MCNTHFELYMQKLKARSAEMPNGCLVFTGCTNLKGYGTVTYKGKTQPLHRLVYMMLTSTKPEIVMHKCDNPGCWNILHLRGGTHKDNVTDKVAKNRQSRVGAPQGSHNGQSVLNETKVREIKLSKESLIILANRYNVCVSSISQIRTGKTWKHVIIEESL